MIRDPRSSFRDTLSAKGRISPLADNFTNFSLLTNTMSYYYSYSANKNSHYYKKPFRKTKGFYILIILMLAIAIFIYYSIKKADQNNINPFNFSNEEKVPSFAAKVVSFSGQLQSKKDANWENIGENYQIGIDSSVKTGENSKAIIELPDKSIIRLSSNTEMKFIELNIKNITVEQISGNAYHRVNDQSSAIYRVRNGQTELLALGTAFNVLCSSQLTILTVIESKVKVTIHDATSDNVINMRTVESGNQATINPNIKIEQNIQTEAVQATDLLQNDWYAWNVAEDKKSEFFLGMFAQALKLEITEPKETTTTTDQDKITIKGTTETGAEIFIAGKEVENNNGNFETETSLTPGENKIEITVKKDKNSNRSILLVTSTKEAKMANLTGAVENKNSIKLSWDLTNVKDEDYDKFVVVQGSTENPTYPEAVNHTIAKNTFQDSWDNLTDGQYFFRVCLLTTENKCLSYSNNFSTTIGAGSTIEGKITLTATNSKDNANLTWSLSSDITDIEAFKTIISESENPVFPGNSYHSLANNQRNDTWKKLIPKKYHFRVCLLKNNSCILYSNDATVTIKSQDVASITLSGYSSSGLVYLSWKNTNVDVTKGYKVIINDASGGIFPGQGHHLVFDNTISTDSWAGLDLGKTYYFKVCQSNATGCGTYSNEIAITVE